MTDFTKTGDYAKQLIELRNKENQAFDWPEPKPLPTTEHKVAPFDPHLLPASLRDWVVDISERMECPIDYPAVGTMVALGVIVGRKLTIAPKRRDDWHVVPNLWGAVVGRPSTMKTPSVAKVLAPLFAFENDARRQFKQENQDYQKALDLFRLRRQARRREVLEALKEDVEREDEVVDLGEGEPEPPRRLRLIVNDSTVEKLGELLNENPNGLLCFRDELMGWLTSLDRHGQEGARAFYLEAWDGLGGFTYDRIGRGTLDVTSCCVSILGGIQPGPLLKYLSAAVNGGIGDDGLLQRFQLIVWPEVAEEWEPVDRPPNEGAKERALAVLKRLYLETADQFRSRYSPNGDGPVERVRFQERAQSIFDEWRNVFERRLRRGNDHQAFEAHLAKYRSLVPSLALLIHVAEQSSGSVTQDAVERAIQWVTYLESHARRLYGLALGTEQSSVAALRDRLLAGHLNDGFTAREVYRKQWAELRTREVTTAAIRVLEDHHWLSPALQASSASRTTRYLVNPRIYSRNPTDSTDSTDTTDSWVAGA